MKFPWKKEKLDPEAKAQQKAQRQDRRKAGFASWKAGFSTRAFRVGGYSVAATAIVLAIAIALNVFVGALPTTITQVDVTASQLYSLSDQTDSILSGLEEDITIYWIVQSGSEDETLELLLGRYESKTDKITVEKKDPDVYPTFASQYGADSITNNSLVVECGETYRYIDGGDLYEYDYTNYYTTGTYDTSFAGESLLTSAINYVISDDLPKLYTLTGHGESSLSTSFQSAVEQQNIETEELSLLTEASVPEDADAVLIYAPQSDLSTQELEALQTYLQSGGNLILLTDPLQDDTELTNFAALMADYGVSVAEGIVIEGNQSNYAWGTPYYLLPDLGSHDIVSPLSEAGYYVLLSIAQGIQVSDDLDDSLTVEELLTTSDEAFSKVAGYSLTTYSKEDGDIDGPFALAVAITDELEDGGESKLVWVSSSSLLDDETNQQVSGGNEDLFLNALSWMCGQEDSISIHAKSLSYEYLTIDSGTSSTLTAAVIFVIPVAYLAVGIVVWIRRRRK